MNERVASHGNAVASRILADGGVGIWTRIDGHAHDARALTLSPNDGSAGVEDEGACGPANESAESGCGSPTARPRSENNGWTGLAEAHAREHLVALVADGGILGRVVASDVTE